MELLRRIRANDAGLRMQRMAVCMVGLLMLLTGCASYFEPAVYDKLVKEIKNGSYVCDPRIDTGRNIAYLGLLNGEYTGFYLNFAKNGFVKSSGFMPWAYTVDGDTIKLMSPDASFWLTPEMSCLLIEGDSLISLWRDDKKKTWERGSFVYVVHDFGVPVESSGSFIPRWFTEQCRRDSIKEQKEANKKRGNKL